MPPLAAVPGSSAPSGPRVPEASPASAFATGARAAPGTGSPAGAEGEELPAASAIGKCLPATGEFSPGRSREMYPLHSAESIGLRSGEGTARPRDRNTQPFVSLDEVRYSAAGHENRHAKWLPRPPPTPREVARPEAPRCPGRAGAGRPSGRVCPGRAGGTRHRGAARLQTRNAPVPPPAPPSVRAAWSTLEAGRREKARRTERS